MAASPAAVSAVPVAVSVGAFVAAVRVSGPTVEAAAAVFAECPVACGHQRLVAVISAAPADVFARHAGAPDLAAGGDDPSAAGAFARARDWRERRWALRPVPSRSREDGSNSQVSPILPRHAIRIGLDEGWQQRRAGRGSQKPEKSDSCSQLADAGIAQRSW